MLSTQISAIVIDDDKDIVSVFCDYLKLKNIDVLGFGHDGQDAAKLYAKFKPDIAFLDLRMPKYDGLFGLKEIRTIDSDAVVIIITADGSIENNSELLSLKPNAILHKPFEIEKIMQVVDKLMSERKSIHNET